MFKYASALSTEHHTILPALSGILICKSFAFGKKQKLVKRNILDKCDSKYRKLSNPIRTTVNAVLGN